MLVSTCSDEIADASGRDRGTMQLIKRLLLENGMLSQKGRGRGAAHATKRDAVTLTFAALAPVQPKQVVTPVRQLLETRANRRHSFIGFLVNRGDTLISTVVKIMEAEQIGKGLLRLEFMEPSAILTDWNERVMPYRGENVFFTPGGAKQPMQKRIRQEGTIDFSALRSLGKMVGEE